MDKNDTCAQERRNVPNANKEEKIDSDLQKSQNFHMSENIWLRRASKDDFRRTYFKMLGINTVLTLLFGLVPLVMLCLGRRFEDPAALLTLLFGLVPLVMLGGAYAICALVMWVPVQIVRLYFESYVQLNILAIWVALAVLLLVVCIILKWVMVPYWQAKLCRVRDMGGNPYDSVIKPLKVQSTCCILVIFLNMFLFPSFEIIFFPVLLFVIGIRYVLRRLVFLPYKKAAMTLSPPEKGSTSWGDYILLGCLLVWADFVFSEEFKAVKFNSVDDASFLLLAAIWIFTCVFDYVALLSILYAVVVFIKCLVCKSKKTQLADDVMDTEKDSGENV